MFDNVEINISKKDIYWSYLATIFSFSNGLLVLPLILKMLTPNELGINFLMSTFSGLVLLLDFGFSVQFSRTYTYLFSGAQSLTKEGFNDRDVNINNLNFRLIYATIESSKYLYKRISLIALFLMITLGSFYIYKITDEFRSIDNIFLIWCIFCLSIFFNIYFSFYEGLLKGRGMLKELNKIVILSRFLQISLTIFLLSLEIGLLAIVISNFIYPFLSRFLMIKVFYTKEMKGIFQKITLKKFEVLELIKIVWFNSRKMGLVFIGSFLIGKVSFLIASFYLTLNEIASFGLMEQLIGFVVTVSVIYFNSHLSRFSFLRLNNCQSELLNIFSLSLGIFYLFYFIGIFLLFVFSDFIFQILDSNVNLPSSIVFFTYCLVVFLEQNHSLFATFLVTKNSVPFVYPSLISGVIILFLTLICFQFFVKELLVIVVVPGLVQICYNNWKWPSMVFNDFNISIKEFFKILLDNFKFIFLRNFV